jgi:hypothetical protein
MDSRERASKARAAAVVAVVAAAVDAVAEPPARTEPLPTRVRTAAPGPLTETTRRKALPVSNSITPATLRVPPGRAAMPIPKRSSPRWATTGMNPSPTSPARACPKPNLRKMAGSTSPTRDPRAISLRAKACPHSRAKGSPVRAADAVVAVAAAGAVVVGAVQAGMVPVRLRRAVCRTL